MNNNATKTLIIIVLVMTFMLSAFGIYKYFKRNTTVAPTIDATPSFPISSDTPAPAETNVTPTGSFPQQTGSQTMGTRQPRTTNQIQAIDKTENIKIISEKPATGSMFIEKIDPGSKNKKLFVRYEERTSGHIFEMGHNENLAKKLSNTTITRIYQSIPNVNGQSMLIRRFDDNNNAQNIYASLTEPIVVASTTVGENLIGKLNQSLLSPDIKEVAVSPNATKIFYLTKVGSDFIGTIEDFGGKQTGVNKKQVFNSPLSEWLIQWPQDNTLYLNTKPSANVPGFLFSQVLNKASGITKILGDINGLTSNISPDPKYMVYSESVAGGIKTYLFNITTREKFVLPLTTLPEKCIWGGINKTTLYCAVPTSLPTVDYPDAWYQGIISFNDEIWKIDTVAGNTELLLDKATLDMSGGVDAINLVLSPNEDYLLFTNKKDSSLWQIKIK